MKRIITIGREFGAGGGELGRRLARELGIAYYDRDIILRTAKASAHLTPEQVRRWDERVPHEFGFTQSLFNFYDKPLSEELWNAQVKAIRELADKESCVIVGRNADVLLESRQPFKLFVCADTQAKLERCQGRAPEGENLSPKELLRKMKQVDRVRAQTRMLLSGSEWGRRDAYHLIVNTTDWNIKDLAPAVGRFALDWFGRRP